MCSAKDNLDYKSEEVKDWRKYGKASIIWTESCDNYASSFNFLFMPDLWEEEIEFEDMLAALMGCFWYLLGLFVSTRTKSELIRRIETTKSNLLECCAEYSDLVSSACDCELLLFKSLRRG